MPWWLAFIRWLGWVNAGYYRHVASAREAPSVTGVYSSDVGAMSGSSPGGGISVWVEFHWRKPLGATIQETTLLSE